MLSIEEIEMQRVLPQNRDGEPHQAEHGNVNVDVISVTYMTGDAVNDPLVVPHRHIPESTILSIVACADAITAGTAISVGYRDLETGVDYPNHFCNNVALTAGRIELLPGVSNKMRLLENEAKTWSMIITPMGAATIGDEFELHVYRKYHGSN